MDSGERKLSFLFTLSSLPIGHSREVLYFSSLSGSRGKLLCHLVLLHAHRVGVMRSIISGKHEFRSVIETDANEKEFNGINAKMVFLAQTKGRRERERKRKGKEEERKGERERKIGSEALAETEKIANAPAGNRTREKGFCHVDEK